jgi:methyl-accepting chemotaxis protein
MPTPDRPRSPHEWREFAYTNRARIDSLESELNRVRERQHEMAAEVSAIRFLAQQVKDLAHHVEKLGEDVETISRRALERPTAAVVGQYLSVLIAVIALIVAATR